MATIWKHPNSRFWTACFTAYVGSERRQWKRSTHTKDRRLANRIAEELEDAAQGRRNVDQVKAFLSGVSDLKVQSKAREAFDDVMRKVLGTGLTSRSVRDYVQGWLSRTQGEVSPASWTRYQSVCERFLESLQGRAGTDIAALTQEDFVRFRDSEARRTSNSSANSSMKIIRIVFGAAEADGLITRNEAKFVRRLKTEESETKRRALTLAEIQTLLRQCNDEWRSLVVFGFYTGARLGDLAMLTWHNIDLSGNELRYQSRKGKRRVAIPLAKPLRDHLDQIPAGDDPDQPLHPRAYEIVSRQGRTGMLSRQFYEIMAQAGLVPKRSHSAAKEGKGRGGTRTVGEISFHSLRHTAVSLLKSAGVSEAVAMDLVGHDSTAISRHYTKISGDAKTDAVNRLPELNGG